MAFSNKWVSKSVQVNAIAPGYITTDNTQALRDNEERSESILARIPTEANEFKDRLYYRRSIETLEYYQQLAKRDFRIKVSTAFSL